MSSTAHGIDWPSLLQFSVFLPNRVGALQHLLRRFQGERIRILGLSVVNLVDCAVVRLVFDAPDLGRRILREAEYALNETSLLAVEVSELAEQPLLSICTTLLRREVSIDYVYPMFRSAQQPTVLMLHVDDIGTGAEALRGQGFKLLSEADL